MGMVLGLALILFTSLWTSDVWLKRTNLVGAPWEEPRTTATNTVIFSEPTAAAVQEYVERVRAAGTHRKGKKTSQADVYHGQAEPKLKKGRDTWKNWVKERSPAWKLSEAIDQVLVQSNLDPTSVLRMSQTRTVRT